MKKIITSIVLFILTYSSLIAQCPMCKASVESSQRESTKSVGMGLNIGILMLLATVYILLMVVGIMFYRYYKRNLMQNAQ